MTPWSQPARFAWSSEERGSAYGQKIFGVKYRTQDERGLLLLKTLSGRYVVGAGEFCVLTVVTGETKLEDARGTEYLGRLLRHQT